MVIGERLAHISCLYEINDPLTHWRIAIYFCSAIHQNITRCCSANGLKCQKPWSVAILALSERLGSIEEELLKLRKDFNEATIEEY